jgi:DNA-binding transcriptional ArsR family regulator
MAADLYNHLVMPTAPVLQGLSEQQLDRAFGALADPTRRAILARLSQGDAGVLDVAAPFPMSQPAITKHLRVLEEAGLISRHRQARQRLCRLQPERLKELSDWVGSYREFWEESFERLDEVLEELQGSAMPTSVRGTTKGEGT